jgi:hypothetical protein
MRGQGALLAPFEQHVIYDLLLALLATSIAPVPFLLEQSAVFSRDRTRLQHGIDCRQMSKHLPALL